MATKNRTDASLLGTLVAGNVYKRNQGRLTRQVTVICLWFLIGLGCYTLSQQLLGDFVPGAGVRFWFTDKPAFILDRWSSAAIRIGLPVLLAAIGGWIAYRMVNYPRFADFLVSVEAEMAKVSWPSKDELYRATIVVITTMFMLAAMLFIFDLVWQNFFSLIDVIRTSAPRAR